MAPEEVLGEEEMTRLHHIGVVDALTDCLALAVQEQLAGPQLQSIVQLWLAQTCTETSTQTSPDSRLTLPGGAVATEVQAAVMRRGMSEGYGACAAWAAQGLAHDVLATRILRRIFAVWPRAAADYQARYDAYLEKELQNPGGAYYASSRLWRMDVENLRTRATCAEGQSAVIGKRSLHRAVKLLHRQPERIAAARAAAHETAGNLAAIKPPTQRSGSTLEAGSSAGR